MAQPQADGRYRNLGLRLKTAALFIPPVFAAIYFGAPWYDLMVGLAAVAMLWEWACICRRGAFGLWGWIAEAGLIAAILLLYAAGDHYTILAIAVVAATMGAVGVARGERAVLHLAAGALLVGIFCLAFLWLRAYPDDGRSLVIWLVCAVWFTDTGAYAAGKTFGGPKLAPRISPNKTWAELAGGVAAAAVWSVAFLGLYEGHAMLPVAAAAVCTALLAQAGDLTVSLVKRRYGVKDASGLVPGHGGVLDRLDGMLLTGPAAALCVHLTGRSIL